MNRSTLWLTLGALFLVASACSSDTLNGGSDASVGSSSGRAFAGSSAGSTSAGKGTSSSGAAAGSSSGSVSGTAASASAGGATSTGTGGLNTTGGTTNGTTAGSGVGPGTSSGGSATGTGGASTGTGGGTTGGADGGATCEPACPGFATCCDGTCVNLATDTTNCGQCGNRCAPGDYCESSACAPATCPSEGCDVDAGGTCCGFQCCGGEDVCCLVHSTVVYYMCLEPDGGTCPLGCGNMCVSRRDAKRDIQYLDEQQLQTAEDQVLRIPLARFNYKWDRPDERRRLGFIIDDVAPNPGVIDEARGEVDLYGYTSLAVAALQEQAKEIEKLRRQVAALQKRLDAPPPKRARKP